MNDAPVTADVQRPWVAGALLHLLQLLALAAALYVALSLPLRGLLSRGLAMPSMGLGPVSADLTPLVLALGSYLIAFVWLLPGRRVPWRRLLASLGLLVTAAATLFGGMLVVVPTVGLAAPLVGFMAGIATNSLHDLAQPIAEPRRRDWTRVHIGGAVLASLLFTMTFLSPYWLFPQATTWLLTADGMAGMAPVLALPHALFATSVLVHQQALPPAGAQVRRVLIFLAAALLLAALSWSLGESGALGGSEPPRPL